MTPPPFRVVLLGLGHAGRQLHLPALERLPGIEVVLACDPDPARRDAVAGLRTCAAADEALSAAADAAVIATPPSTHAPLALAALDRGLHVYVEKPMATEVAAAGAVADRASATGRTLQVGHAYRYHPLWQRLEAMVRAGRLRGPFHAEAVFDGEPGEGWDHPLVNVGLHHVDLLAWMAGEPPTEVEVRDGGLRARWHDGSTLSGTYGPGPGQDRMRLLFGHAAVELDRRRGLRLRGAGVRAALPSPALLRARPGSTGWDRSFERALAAFAAAASRGAPAVPGPLDGLRWVEVGMAILRSLAEGGPVVVDLGA